MTSLTILNDMKNFIKRLLEKYGIRLNFIKNLWYLNSFQIVKNLTTKQNPIIFDIGACDGSSIFQFKKLFPESIIYSFEPYPDTYGHLAKFSEKYSDVYHYNFALSNNNGIMNFFVNKSKATNSLLKPIITNSFVDEHTVPEENIKVVTKTLDTFLAENKINEIDILKIDVQGGELLVFEGAKETLKNKKVKIIYAEIWFIEGYKGQPLYHDIASYLATFGYFPFGIYNMHYRKDGHFIWGDSIFYLK